MSNLLEQRARSRGVQTSYEDAFHDMRYASPDALRAVLDALGEPTAAGVEPCVVAWDGVLPARIRGVVHLEGGTERRASRAPLPIGYHRLDSGTHVIAAPSRCWAPDDETPTWGVFAPLYALRSARSDRFGGADFGDLATAIDWVRELGGGAVGTLPLLATADDDASPYLPLSRRFWNETYLDLGAIPELDALPDGFEAQSAALAAGELMDYPRLVAHRRRALEGAAARMAQQQSERRDRFEAFAAGPLVDAYARFRAAGDERKRHYHAYVQWLCHEQLGALASRGLYLDLPVGVHPAGFDANHERDVFAQGVSVGAPPDPLFEGGQNWTIPALHPERSRATGHRYFASCVRAHMELAKVLRIDHVMGLFRRFWIPRDMPATEGVYVRLPGEELVAVVSVESHRNQTIVVGEDLGTVEPAVRKTMARRNMRRTYVGQLAEDDDVPAGCVASVNTHDTPLFAAICDDDDPRAALEAWLDRLAASDAWLVLVTLEDLWLETRQQNVPGTTAADYPSWRGRMRYALDEIARDEQLLSTLRHARRVKRRR